MLKAEKLKQAEIKYDYTKSWTFATLGFVAALGIGSFTVIDPPTKQLLGVLSFVVALAFVAFQIILYRRYKELLSLIEK